MITSQRNNLISKRINYLHKAVKVIFVSLLVFVFSVQTVQAQTDTNRTDSVHKTKISGEQDLMTLFEFKQEADGLWRARYPDGKVMAEGQMKMRGLFRRILLMEGKWVYYDREGKPVEIHHYHKGRLVRVETPPEN
jgi:antitoxin component YwqK of YwqJK toxin-antitoxin module